MFNTIRLSRYSHPKKVVFNNRSEFKQDFTALINDFSIKPVLTTNQNRQDNDPVEHLHQVILNLIVTKDIDNNVFNYNTAFRDNFPRFACWGDLILIEFKNQFCAFSAQPGQKYKSGLLFNTNIPEVLQVGYYILVRGIYNMF